MHVHADDRTTPGACNCTSTGRGRSKLVTCRKYLESRKLRFRKQGQDILQYRIELELASPLTRDPVPEPAKFLFSETIFFSPQRLDSLRPCRV